MYSLMLADDEALERQTISLFIRNSHVEIGDIYECTNGQEAVETALIKRPDIIIMDIKMPGFSGIEAIEKIKAMNLKSKVIFSTAYSYFDYAVKAVQLGAMDFMVKPVNKDKVIKVLTCAIDQIDAERQKETRREQYEQLMDLLERKASRGLILGNMDEEVLYFLDVLGVEYGSTGICGCVFIDSNLGKNKKQLVAKTIKEDLGTSGYTAILGEFDDSIYIIVFLSKSHKKDALHHTLDNILASVFRDVKAGYKAAFGPVFQDIEEIEGSYIGARAALGDGEYAAKKAALPSGTPRARGDVPREIQEACTYLEEKYMERLTLDSIASAVGYSKFYLSRLFKQYKGMTIVEYLIKIRLDKAKELLKDSSYSIKQISVMTGYSDPNYFTLAFKKAEGISPVKYRHN